MVTTHAEERRLVCYVIMPFSAGEVAQEHRDRYSAIVEAAVRAYNLDPERTCVIDVKRADDPQNVGRISAAIIADLQSADVVIADLKGLNPNVMYELGIRHSLRSGTIILVPEEQPLPFDVNDSYVLRYRDRGRAVTDLAERLKFLTARLMARAPVEDSPVLADGLEPETLPRLKLGTLGRELAELIGQRLSTTSDWAVDALQHVRVGWISRPLFDERSRHFREEKDFIGRRFADFLWERCSCIVREGYPRARGSQPPSPNSPRRSKLATNRIPKVYLVLDSGTTLVPLFRALAARALREYRKGERDAVSAIEVVTNNLPGLGELIEHGCPEPSRYSEPVLSCQLLPGIPMPVYSAVTGQLTEDALKNLKEKSKSRGENAVFIGVLTGNWIRVRREGPPCPVPMARGESHQQFEQVLVNLCDEAYVLASLGKVVVGQGEANVNEVLGYSDAEGRKDPERVPYKDVKIDNAKARTVRLVSTDRPKNYLLSNHGVTMKAVLDKHSDVQKALRAAGRVINDIPHIIEQFGEVPADPYRQFLAEFPHEHTRNNPRFLKMFDVERPRS
jgi:hypothetical protein